MRRAPHPGSRDDGRDVRFFRSITSRHGRPAPLRALPVQRRPPPPALLPLRELLRELVRAHLDAISVGNLVRALLVLLAVAVAAAVFEAHVDADVVLADRLRRRRGAVVEREKRRLRGVSHLLERLDQLLLARGEDLHDGLVRDDIRRLRDAAVDDVKLVHQVLRPGLHRHEHAVHLLEFGAHALVVVDAVHERRLVLVDDSPAAAAAAAAEAVLLERSPRLLPRRLQGVELRLSLRGEQLQVDVRVLLRHELVHDAGDVAHARRLFDLEEGVFVRSHPVLLLLLRALVILLARLVAHQRLVLARLLRPLRVRLALRRARGELRVDVLALPHHVPAIFQLLVPLGALRRLLLLHP
eukprot:23761-Pelagococcus_subviridis.AAC.3